MSMSAGKVGVAMKIRSLGSWVAAIAVVCLAGSAGVASVMPHDLEGHKSSLQARLTMSDGTARVITLRGVGGPTSMCSRVRARNIEADGEWLDGLASVRKISHNADGPVRAMLTFRDGAEREVSIVAANRVLYVAGWFGLTEKLDLGKVSEIDFE
jgi:hypothetical protein